MGGLRKRLPVPFWSFVIGSAALAALPATAGFASKDLILLRAWEVTGDGTWLWSIAALGALITALYSFKLVFLVFFGELKTEPTHQPGWRMAIPLMVLCVLSIVGGYIALPLANVLPLPTDEPVHGTIALVSAAIPIVGVCAAYLLFLGRQVSFEGISQSPAGQWIAGFWYAGWGMDSLYRKLIVAPYTALAQWWRNEPIDHLVALIAGTAVFFNGLFATAQNGRLGRYITVMVLGLLLMLATLVMGVAA